SSAPRPASGTTTSSPAATRPRRSSSTPRSRARSTTRFCWRCWPAAGRPASTPTWGRRPPPRPWPTPAKTSSSTAPDPRPAAMTKDRKLILLGDSAFAEVAHEYFTHDSPYEVAAFSVERAFLKRDSLFGKPVVPFEELEQLYAPGEHSFYAALV